MFLWKRDVKLSAEENLNGKNKAFFYFLCQIMQTYNKIVDA